MKLRGGDVGDGEDGGEVLYGWPSTIKVARHVILPEFAHPASRSEIIACRT